MTGFWGGLFGVLTVLAGSGLALGAALGLTGLLILKFHAGGATFVAAVSYTHLTLPTKIV